jgi:hypothetical protein
MALYWKIKEGNLEKQIDDFKLQLDKASLQTEHEKPPMKETVLKTMLSLIPIFDPIASGVYERYKSSTKS